MTEFRLKRVGRVPGHRRLSLTHNGKRDSSESAWTWECECGAIESAGTRVAALYWWGQHKEYMAAVILRRG